MTVIRKIFGVLVFIQDSEMKDIVLLITTETIFSEMGSGA